MRKSKNIKRKLAELRSTENRALNEIQNQRIQEIIKELDSHWDDRYAQIEIIRDLVTRIKNGQEEREVLSIIMRRRKLLLSLQEII